MTMAESSADRTADVVNSDNSRRKTPENAK